MLPIVCYENQKVVGPKPGTSDERERYIEQFPQVFQTVPGGFCFRHPGVYQIGQSSPILVLPWFFSSAHVGTNPPEGAMGRLMDVIKTIKYAFDDMTGAFSSVRHSALELTLHSILQRTFNSLEVFPEINFFEQRDEVLNTIRGKWNAAHDLRSGPIPLSFSCSYHDLSHASPLIRCLLYCAHMFDEISSSLLNHALATDIIRSLNAIAPDLDRSPCFDEARIFLFNNEQFKDWAPVIEFGESIFTEREVLAHECGVSFSFPLHAFFEDVVSEIFSFRGGSLDRQPRYNLLGGALWHRYPNTISTVDTSIEIVERKEDLSVHAAYSSRPDLFFTRSRTSILIECKYKDLARRSGQDGVSSISSLSLDRDDRNQILSFLLSIPPNSIFRLQNVHFVVFYPLSAEPIYRCDDLLFPKISINSDSSVKHISQFLNLEESRMAWKVRFIGINLLGLLRMSSRQKMEFYDTLENVCCSRL